MNALHSLRPSRVHPDSCRHFRRTLSPLTRALLATILLAPGSRVDAIQFIQDYNEIDRPSFDPDGTELRRIATSAAIIWEDYILDDRTFEYELSWDNIDHLGEFHFYPGFSKKIIIDTHDEFGVLRDWFIDPTPLENEEYNMYQTLYGTSQSEPGFAGTPPDLLETGWEGGAISRGPASGKRDLLSVVLHEMGHYLGINLDVQDSAFNLNSATIGGVNNVSIYASDEPFLAAEHFEDVGTALMTHDLFPSARRLPSATDILATWDESQFTQYDVPRVDFIGAQSTSWDAALNWVGGRVPDWDNKVYVRHGGQARLTSDFSSAASLAVLGNSSVTLADNSYLLVEGPVVVGSVDSGIPGPPGQVHIGGLGQGHPALEADSVLIQTGYVNLQSPTSLLLVNGTLKVEAPGDLFGAGMVLVGGLLQNEGEVIGGAFLLLGTGGELTLRTQGAGRLDLDGASEQGQMSTALGNLLVDGIQDEPFSGVASIAAGRKMTFMQSFAFDGSLVFSGDPNVNNTVLSGSLLWLRGRIDVTGKAGIDALTMVFNNPDQETTVHAGGGLSLSPGRMGLGSSPDVYRGRIVLEQNATLHLNVGLASSWELAGSMTMTNAMVTGDDIINTGHLRGSGTLYVLKLENAGTVEVGNSIGVLNIGEGGRYVQTASGTLAIEIAASHGGSRSDVLNVTSVATLDGKLSVAFIDGFLPSAGARYDFLTASNVFGEFASLDFHAPDGKYVDGRLLYDDERVTLEILASGLAGDFDQDGDVDRKDLAPWMGFFGSKSASHSQGDADGDHDVDGADYLVWQRQFGSMSAVARNAAVPEPATLTLLVTAALAMFVRRRVAVS